MLFLARQRSAATRIALVFLWLMIGHHTGAYPFLIAYRTSSFSLGVSSLKQRLRLWMLMVEVFRLRNLEISWVVRPKPICARMVFSLSVRFGSEAMIAPGRMLPDVSCQSAGDPGVPPGRCVLIVESSSFFQNEAGNAAFHQADDEILIFAHAPCDDLRYPGISF